MLEKSWSKNINGEDTTGMAVVLDMRMLFKYIFKKKDVNKIRLDFVYMVLNISAP
jgi:hypothetical protein